MGENVQPTGAVVTEDPAAEKLKLVNQHRGGANWFFWIAGLSLVNSIVILVGGGWSFVVGLGITQVFDAVAAAAVEEGMAGASGTVLGIVFLLDLAVAGVFVLFGVLARKGYVWAFVVGMVLYGLDGLLFLLVQDWLSIAFHAFALVGLFGGLSAWKKLQAMEPAKDPAFDSAPITP